MATQYVQYPNPTLSSGPLQFTRNGATQTVTEDTAVPANNRPLPTELTGPNGTASVVVEDTPSTGGEIGLVPLAVRNSAGAVKTSADGDYGTLTVDDTGRLRVDAAITTPTAYPEDSAAVSGNTGDFILAVRNDASAVVTSNDGDYSQISVDSSGRPKVIVEGSLPTGANVIGKVQLQDNAGSAIVLGQQAMAASVPVVIANNQTAVPISGTINTGLTQQPPFIRNDYTGTPVTTAAYVQLVAALGSNVKKITLFDSSGQTLKLALGGVGVEVDQMVIPPGGLDGMIDFVATAGQRLSIKAISADATVGEIDINLFN